MKKIVFSFAVLAILTTATTVSLSRHEINATLDVNVEALARSESSPTTGKWMRIHDALGCYKHHICDINGDGSVCGPIGSTTYLP